MRAQRWVSRRVPSLAVGLVSLATSGCTTASFRWSKPETLSSRVVSIEEREDLTREAFVDSATLEGTTLTVRAVRRCARSSETVTETVLRREERRTYAPSKEERVGEDRFVARKTQLAWHAGGALPLVGGGAALLGLGVTALAEDPTSRTGAERDRAVAVTAVGAVLVASYVVGSVLAARPFWTLPQQTVARQTRSRDHLGACAVRPAVGVPLVAAAGARTLELGTSDASGALVVKLERFIGAKELLEGESRWTLVVAPGGPSSDEPTEVATEPFFTAMEDAVWAMADPAACARARSRAACDGIARYLAVYPRGKHADEGATLRGAVVPDTSELAR
jgi:hypothetical protein